MKIVEPSFKILHMADGDEILRLLELAARTCYKSEDKIEQGTAAPFLKRILKTGHESVIEHVSATVRLVCDRGVTHEIVRHRLCAFSQESTRYANYSKERFGNEITVIRPFFWEEGSEQFEEWKGAMEMCEKAYLNLLAAGARAQEARSVLPNSLKTDIVMTANMREWRHIFKLRCSKASHPQMRQSMLPLLAEFNRRVPVLFEELYELHRQELRG
ncbi:MAG: FAD-dependent thymidylate synthase [Desulfobacterium sp.]|jgi:thymidylate synthase (FAD)|nr:FAD-dependent thymidylate synthase [Desulfobacterium sp.]